MKRVILLFVAVLLPIVALFSCNSGEPSSDTGKEPVGNEIYGSGIDTVLVIDLNASEQVQSGIDAIADEINSLTGKYPSKNGDTQPKSAHEIVVGDTTRPITAKAKELLANKIKKEVRSSSDEEAALADTVGYAIYAEGGSVAVVWSDWHIAEMSVDYFIDKYITDDSLKLTDGYSEVETLSLDAYLEERGKNIREEQWAALEDKIGSEYGSTVVASLRNLYTLYRPDAVTWLANLYDADIGGFYYSNSARNTEGFLPDIESTVGALSFVESSGMAELFDNDYSKALPAEMLQKIGKWVQSLQDEDGYYYHPQWPKEYLQERGLQSRITRDKGSAIRILRKVGMSEVYQTSSYELSGKLSAGRDVVTAVSKLIPTATLSQFESVEKFTAYINELDAEVLEITNPVSRANKLYSIGNEFQSTWQDVAANPEYVTILHQFFKKHQDPVTGTWSTVLTYDATDSLHKIGYVYNKLGLEFEYVDQMIATVITILSKDSTECTAESAVDLSNAWASIEHIYTNLRTCSSNPDEAEKKLEEVKTYVYANVSQAIDATASHVAIFIQDDGSFGYTPFGSSYTSQGCLAAVAGSAEGDVNGHCAITATITNYIAYALDLPEYEVKIYSEKERVTFVRILESLGTIIKDKEELTPDVPITFEDGQLPEQFIIGTEADNPVEGASVAVEEIDGNKVMHVVAVPTQGAPGVRNYAITVPINLTSTQANAAVMEFDLCVYDEGSDIGEDMIQWSMKENGAIIIYPRIGKTSAGKVALYDGNRAVIAVLGNLGEKINLRFEYFWNEGEYKVYVNNEFKAKGNNLYAQSLINKPLTEMTLYTPKGWYANYYIDNIRCSRVSKAYDPNETLEFPDKPVTEDFEGEVNSVQVGTGNNITTEKNFSAIYPTDSANKGGATAVVRTDEVTGNKFLSVYAPKRTPNTRSSHALSMAIPTQMAENPNTYVFETKLKLNSISTATDFIQITFLNTSTNWLSGSLHMSVDDSGKVCLAGLPVGYFDEWFTLKLEYHLEAGVIRVYNNDLYMGEITEFSSSDSLTAKKVEKLKTITGFTFGAYNANGSLSFSVDDFTIYTTAMEYTEKVKDTLPAPNPDKDDFVPELPQPPKPDEPDEPGTGGEPEPGPDIDPGIGNLTPPENVPEDNETEAAPLPGEGTSPDDYLPSDPDGWITWP